MQPAHRFNSLWARNSTCTNTECGKSMRPKDTLKTDYPGTVASGHSGEGKTCVKPVVDKPKERKPR